MSGAPPRTYWHLLGTKRVPSEYEIVSSRLLYYPGRGFEVKVPAAAWYERYQRDSAWQCADWERFHDPRETTYAAYTARRAQQETYVDGLLESIDRSAHDRTLSPAWRAALDLLFAPLLYPLHGLQMIASYVGQMAPSGRIAIAALFQSADEVRRIHRFGYRLKQLQQTWPEFARDPRALWQHDPAWQPLREAVEHLLVTYDWGEAFVALNLCLKPAFDELVTIHLANSARAQGDPPLAQILGSLREDALWQREWSHALVETVWADMPVASRAPVRAWADHWSAVALRAVAPLAAGLDALDAGSEPGVCDRIADEMRARLAALDLASATPDERSPAETEARRIADPISH